MIRVVICENDRAVALRLRNLVDAYMRNNGQQNVDVALARSYSELGIAMKRLRPSLFDLVLCRVESGEESDSRERLASGMRALQENAPEARFILISSDASNASAAYDAGIPFLQIPFEQELFKRTLDEALCEIMDAHRMHFAVKTSRGTANMNLNDITFVETGRKGPIIHLPNDREIITRGSLQALFARLNELDDRFVRAGGSFIVNLDNIRTVGDGSVIFGDGEAIILPVRARKPIQEAFSSYRLRPTA